MLKKNIALTVIEVHHEYRWIVMSFDTKAKVWVAVKESPANYVSWAMAWKDGSRTMAYELGLPPLDI